MSSDKKTPFKKLQYFIVPHLVIAVVCALVVPYWVGFIHSKVVMKHHFVLPSQSHNDIYESIVNMRPFAHDYYYIMTVLVGGALSPVIWGLLWIVFLMRWQGRNHTAIIHSFLVIVYQLQALNSKNYMGLELHEGAVPSWHFALSLHGIESSLLHKSENELWIGLMLVICSLQIWWTNRYRRHGRPESVLSEDEFEMLSFVFVFSEPFLYIFDLSKKVLRKLFKQS